MNDAFKVWDEMLSIGFNPTLLTYNTLIQGLCKSQEGDLAEGLLNEMVTRGIRPNDNTYYSLIKGIGNVEEFIKKGCFLKLPSMFCTCKKKGISLTQILLLEVSFGYFLRMSP